jgi:hypothetical protein
VNAADVDGAGGDGAGGAAAARDDEVLLKSFFDKHNLCPAMQQEVQSAYKAAGFPCKELKPLSYGSLAITYFRMTCLGASRPLFAGFPDRQGELLCLNVAAPLKSKTHFQKPAVSREYTCMVGAACSQNGAILAAGDIVSISQRCWWTCSSSGSSSSSGISCSSSCTGVPKRNDEPVGRSK